jgi:two-component system chemotaxis response regulator CheY
MPYRVLIVDDSATMRKIVAQILSSADLEICGEAENGLDAIKKYKELKPDLVTMDINMPEMDGIQALKEIKKNDSSAKIMMMTSDSQETVVKDAIAEGASDYIVKPPDKDIVLKKIKKVLGN